jgi:hypothetical protein
MTGMAPSPGVETPSSRTVQTKTELIILLRPIVVDGDDDWPRIIQPAATRLGAMRSAR